MLFKKRKLKRLNETVRCVNCGARTSLSYGGVSRCRSCIAKMRKPKKKGLLQR